ncbi:unnamed protein product [Ectocarpus sp. CCAP 1310/34]|nr:unnamed protein product [Ectocarpus sp. CCAP 1310/34]
MYDYKFTFHEMEMSMKHHMDLVMKAKSGFRLIYVMYVVLVKSLSSHIPLRTWKRVD